MVLRPAIVVVTSAFLLTCGGMRPKIPEVSATCAVDADCTLACSPGMDCCYESSLCGCEHAVHVDQQRAYQDWANRWCDGASHDCPVASCPRPEYDVVPVCVEGVCQARRQPEHIECRQDADCVVYCPRAENCCEATCSCTSVWHKDAALAFEAMRDSECTGRELRCPKADCPITTGPIPACRAGRCVALPEG